MENDNRWKQLAHMIAVLIVREIKDELKKGTGGSIAPRALTIDQASKYVSRSETALYKLVAKGEIPVVRHGRSLRFDVRQLDEWLLRDGV